MVGSELAVAQFLDREDVPCHRHIAPTSSQSIPTSQLKETRRGVVHFGISGA